MSENQPTASDFNRSSEDATCERCGAPRGPRAKRFCSQRCWYAWRSENPPRLLREAPSREQVMTEMREALARAQKEVGP